MKMFIPDIGTIITLKEDWTFDLYYEYRNMSLIDKLVDDESKKFNWDKSHFESIKCLFCQDTILKVDRIYIRKGNSDYSSLTFYVKNGKYQGCRFWAKLHDVNEMEVYDFNKKIIKYDKQYEYKFGRYGNTDFINEWFTLEVNKENDVMNSLYHVIINNQHRYNIEEHSKFIVNSLYHVDLPQSDYLEVITKKDIEHYFMIKWAEDNDLVGRYKSIKECKDYIEQQT
jgi:hypothetical protein